ncbi:hypothetical protein AUEXF2481DRAFT_47780 [Aureobasidium subglaciale EXF-2481]|uniref:F-BAR domain-containing protein n=1 Tax=Aureobasidium subglaciale (strain EXF-2481) TaxID=1043005 RepID=A0A074Z1B6_AURSE|nr:uncharacterized protein AUEXF2481DRAFT_47780 [Aureobasidium subglaciale EXF-2481]KEQ92896.1 hypothetical protein AUEXF2481DRAFT_47780 [Aureobasidium subglaciale EXF-2481]
MAPSVSLSFANNFWGKEDAGVDPLLERMHNAKITSDELKSFYTQRAAIEEEYSRKILNLARKPLGSSEAGTLRMSMDVVRGELEAMGKSHQHIAQQMKGELEEPLSTFSGGIKERRKIIQNGIEKLLKTKTQQTHTVNKARDRYEQDCLKIKGYLAQGHMVMGQEERKNKAKLEKTQIQMSATSNEYETAVKVLEETTARWNREWKAACDKFQDLEEERLDFTKSSLWSFANISSTVCVSDDASCEKIRLSLEDCDVEKDISGFIKDNGTGQEIPDPPKYINFCRGDVSDNASDVSDDAHYSVAQFQRTMNPAFRSSSPQPSTYSSHHDPASVLAQEMALGSSVNSERSQRSQRSQQSAVAPLPVRQSSQQAVPASTYQDFPKVPHNEYPMDGMTQFCRLGPPSDRSSVPSPTRPEDDSHSEISNANSFSSVEPPASPMKQLNGSTVSTNSQQDDKTLQKRRSGFFQNHSPFGRRKSKHENAVPASISNGPAQRNTWAPAPRPQTASSPARPFAREARNVGFGNDPMPSPDAEPVDPRANFQLNIGNNVFDVATPDARRRSTAPAPEEPTNELDPIAQALAELKGVTKQASTRVSADRYAGIPTPAPGAGRASPSPLIANSDIRAGQRGTPPPSYDQPMRRLGAPQPAFTSKQMQQTTASYMTQKRDMFNAPPRNTPSQMGSRPVSRGGDSRGSGEMMRSASPAPLRTSSPAPPRATSPRPSTGYDRRSQPGPPGQDYRSVSPNPYGGPPPGGMSAGRPRAQSSSPIKQQQQRPGYNPAYASHGNSPASAMPRSASPSPQFRGSAGPGSRPTSSRGDPAAMAMQLAPSGDQGYPPSSRGAPNGQQATPLRPTSTYYGAEGGWAAASSPRGNAPPQQAPPSQQQQQQQQQLSTRVRSQSSAGQRQFTRDGRPILQFSRAMYMYSAAIPEELTFAKGDILAVLRLQDDGWWEAEIAGKDGSRGLVPSNYLANA